MGVSGVQGTHWRPQVEGRDCQSLESGRKVTRRYRTEKNRRTMPYLGAPQGKKIGNGDKERTSIRC